MGLFGFILMLIPNNRITIPPQIKMRYNLAENQMLTVDDSNGYMYGYYEGGISGMEDQTITNQTFHTPGDLNTTIDGSGEPFQFQISTSVLNDMFEVILGKN